MIILEPPLKRYTSGKLPTHSGTQNIAENFKSLHQNVVIFVFSKAGYMDEQGKPLKLAVTDGLIDSCEKKVLWNLEKVEMKLAELGVPDTRIFVNQEINEPDDGEPRWVNLGTIGTYFNVTANTIGKWLDNLELRDDDGMGNQDAMDQGLVTISEMNAGGKKTRKISMWNLHPVQRALMEAGHPLDFDYEKFLKGSGKNSNVEVTTIDDRAKQFAKDFMKTFKDPETRHNCEKMVKSQAHPILKRAETLLKKDGFFTNAIYKKYIKN